MDSLRAPIAHHGGAGHHPQAANLGKLRDQLFGDSVGKILLSRIAADIRERQHRDRFDPARNLDRANPGRETIAAPRDRGDVVSSPHRSPNARRSRKII